jgi:hypothetical protein
LLSDERLLLAARDLAKAGQRAPVLLLLAHIEQPAATVAVRDKGLAIGFRDVTQWNLSAILRSAAADGQVAQLSTGWKLLEPGLKSLNSHYSPDALIVSDARHGLKKHIAAISDPNRRRFVEEAVTCFDAEAYRAAVVLSWVGAAYIIQEHIVSKHLAAFNTAGLSRFKSAFRPIKLVKDFGAMKESDMLQLCQDAGILDKAEKQQLQARLDLRNHCGHPNSVIVAEHVVASHVEMLLLNVFSRY